MPLLYKSPVFRVAFVLLMLVSTTLSLLKRSTRRNLDGTWRWLGVKAQTNGMRPRRSARSRGGEDDNQADAIDGVITSKQPLRNKKLYKVAGKLVKDKDGFTLNNVAHTGDRFSPERLASAASKSKIDPISLIAMSSKLTPGSNDLSFLSSFDPSSSSTVKKKDQINKEERIPRLFLRDTRMYAMQPQAEGGEERVGRKPRRKLISSENVSSSIKKATKSSMNIKTTGSIDRPFSLPPGQFKPKQSLGQNFLSDQNYVMKIVDALQDDSPEGSRVVELGPGPGALSRKLFQRYPKMTAVEIDQRAISFLGEKLPGLNVIHMDVLDCDWTAMAQERNGKLSVIGNLPFYITSQILFSLADHWKAVDKAVVTMQYEVAERIVAKTKSKQYGILSVVFQLYGNPVLNFKIPASVFFPRPKVDAALVTIQFQQPHPELGSVNGDNLRKVVTASFRQRRKMLRASLKELLSTHNLELPERWQTLRPEALTPTDFIHLTKDLFGSVEDIDAASGRENFLDPNFKKPAAVWRKALNLYGKEEETDDDDDDDAGKDQDYDHKDE